MGGRLRVILSLSSHAGQSLRSEPSYRDVILPIAREMGACVCPRDLFLCLERAGLVPGLCEQRAGEFDQSRREIRVLGWKEGEQSLLYRSTHLVGYGLEDCVVLWFLAFGSSSKK